MHVADCLANLSIRFAASSPGALLQGRILGKDSELGTSTGVGQGSDCCEP